MTLSKHDEDFADAMALKLRLNREARFTEARLRDKLKNEVVAVPRLHEVGS